MPRRLLSLLLLILVLLLAACGGTAAPSAFEQLEQTTSDVAVEDTSAEPAAAPAAGGQESPMLTERVAAGELPSLEERLPINPAVVEPLGDIGTYGGELRMGFVGSDPGWGGLWFVTGWENLVIWNPDFSGVAPNIAESWEVSEDVTEYTFHLREGMKWSDGEPFTADDIMFYIEDILFDPDLSPAGPGADWLPNEGAEDFRAEKIDDYTVKFIFAQPYGTFLYNLATWSGRHITFSPNTTSCSSMPNTTKT